MSYEDTSIGLSPTGFQLISIYGLNCSLTLVLIKNKNYFHLTNDQSAAPFKWLLSYKRPLGITSNQAIERVCMSACACVCVCSDEAAGEMKWFLNPITKN